MINKLFITCLSAVFLSAFLSACGEDVEAGEPPPGSSVSDAGDVELPSDDPSSSNAKDTGKGEDSEGNEQVLAMPSISSPSYSLVCTSEDNKTLTFKVFNYSSPYPACRNNPSIQCLCEFEMISENAKPTIYYARNTRNFCDEIFKSAIKGESYTLGNGRAVNFQSPAERGYTCPETTQGIDTAVPSAGSGEGESPDGGGSEEENEEQQPEVEAPPADSAEAPFNEHLPIG